MPTARYFIVREQDEWWIKYGTDEFGPYKTQDEAMVFAIDAAKKQIGELKNRANDAGVANFNEAYIDPLILQTKAATRLYCKPTRIRSRRYAYQATA